MKNKKTNKYINNNKSLLDNIDDGDVLIIIPPSASVKEAALGAHNIQAVGVKAGYSVNLFYANLEFSEIIGVKNYKHISNFFGYEGNVSERLFSETAYAEFPIKEYCNKIKNNNWIPQCFIHNNNENQIKKHKNISNILNILAKKKKTFDIETFASIEEAAKQWCKELGKRISKRNFPVVGCTTTFGGVAFSLQLFKEIKKHNPDIITVLGGASCQTEMAEGIISTNYPVDYIFEGEADITFPNFLLNRAKGIFPETKIIPGIRVEELNELPIPKFDDYLSQLKALNSKNAKLISKYYLCYETSRGCWWGQCTFCGLNGTEKKHRSKSPDKIIEELGYLAKRYKHKHFAMSDNILPKPFMKSFVPRLTDELPGLELVYEIKSTQTLGSMIKLKEAGIIQVQPGIESLSDPILNIMKKGATLLDSISLLRYCRSLGGFTVFWNILYGFPNDKGKDYQEMLTIIPLIHHLHPPMAVSRILITRYSPYYDYPDLFGIKELRPASMLYKKLYPQCTDLNKIAYFFEADYESEILQDIDLTINMYELVQDWIDEWKVFSETKMEIFLPTLHISKINHKEFILNDTRKISGKTKSYTLNRDTAIKLLVPHKLDDLEYLQWALDAGIGLLRDGLFIPLASADKELLIEFENEISERNGCGPSVFSVS